jgi:hypothetical protein
MPIILNNLYRIKEESQKPFRNPPSKEPQVTRGVSHCSLAIYIIKSLKAKEE